MLRVTDQLHRVIELEQPATRIISLVPSQTELLHHLGLENEVAGITRFCVHPSNWFTSKKRVGGTKDFKTDVIRSLQPDLILANKEENSRELLEELMPDIPVWISDVNDLYQALEMFLSVGKLTAREEKASLLAHAVKAKFEELPPSPTNPKKVLYLIWRKPWMCAGKSTFIDDMLQRCGFINVCPEMRYPTLDSQHIQMLQPDLILLSSEPYPFSEKHIHELKVMLPKAEIKLVNGEYFSWYGSRMLLAPTYFASIL